jgi:hypothetical protein
MVTETKEKPDVFPARHSNFTSISVDTEELRLISQAQRDEEQAPFN